MKDKDKNKSKPTSIDMDEFNQPMKTMSREELSKMKELAKKRRLKRSK